MTIDLARCRRGMTQLEVAGIPRASLIEEAITAIQRDPAGAFRERYFGIKNYASFGDQREDHSYGMGPRHGAIVFQIGLSNAKRGDQVPLDGDAIYYLEAYRDFESINWPADEPSPSYAKTVRLTLGAAIRTFDALNTRRNQLSDAFAAVNVDSYAPAIQD